MKRFTKKGSKVHFTSDHHFGHKNIIEYCDRPYDSVEEMDEDMTKRWNDIVGPDETIFHLGDFTLGGPEQAAKYFKQLNGKIYVLSNPWHHDKRWIEKQIYQSKYHMVHTLPPIVVLENTYHDTVTPCLVLCHYPLHEWDRSHYGAIHMFGHSHKKRYIHSESDNTFNVGVDVSNYTPRRFSA